MDIRQSENYAKFIQSLGWVVEKAGPPAGGANVFIRHLPLINYFSVIKVQRPTDVDFEQLDKIAKKHHALFVKVEPDLNTKYKIQNTKYSIDNWPLLPTKTLVLDLKKVNFDLLPKDTRYEIRKAEKGGATVQKSDNVELFYKLLQETMKIGKWSVPIRKEVIGLWQGFQPKNSQLLLAYSGSISLGGCLLIWDKNTAHYMYAALTKVGRNTGAAYAILWEAMKFCQRQKLRYLDLEGIYDERFPSQTKNWQGFTKFKMGWRGKVVEYCGSYVKYFNPMAKLLFSVGDLV